MTFEPFSWYLSILNSFLIFIYLKFISDSIKSAYRFFFYLSPQRPLRLTENIIHIKLMFFFSVVSCKYPKRRLKVKGDTQFDNFLWNPVVSKCGSICLIAKWQLHVGHGLKLNVILTRFVHHFTPHADSESALVQAQGGPWGPFLELVKTQNFLNLEARLCAQAYLLWNILQCN